MNPTRVQSYMKNGLLVRDEPPEALLAGIARYGDVDRYYTACFENERLRVSAPYPDNAHEVIEQAVTGVQRTRLTIVNDLIEAGLVTSLPNWWAIPSLRRGRTGDGGTAHRSMVPDSRGERFVLSREGQSWPIFCTWSNFSFNIRELAIGQRMGTPLDTSHSEAGTYRVNEAIEDQAINGLTDDQGSVMTIDGLSAPGLLSSTNTFDYADWNTLTGAQIRAVIMDAIQSLRITHPGPFTIYYPGNYDAKMNDVYTAAYQSGTIRQELEKMGPYGGRNIEVKLADTLPDHRVLVIQMERSAIDVVVGQQPTPLSWKDNAGLNTFWVIIGCIIFRMFINVNGQYGVAVGDLE